VWWPDVPGGDPQAFSAARANPISLDPADPAKARADFIDLYLGSCDPSGQGIDGVLHVSPQRASQPFAVAALPDPLTFSGAPEPVAFSPTPLGSARPFALCGLPPGDLWVYGFAGGDGDPDFIVAVNGNPVAADPVRTKDLWIDVQRDTLGSVSGSVRLNRSVPGATVLFALLSGDPSGQTVIEMLERTVVGDAVVVPYTFESVGEGTFYVASSVTLPGEAEAAAVGFANSPVFVNLSGLKHAVADVTLRLP